MNIITLIIGLKNQKSQMKYINKFKNFILKESKYDIDSILDKINKLGINSLTFYEKKILENPDIQKKLLYQYDMESSKIKELLSKFDIDSEDFTVEETFYLDGEIIIGDYDEDKFNEIINNVDNDFIFICVFEKFYIKNKNKFKYTNKIKEKIKCYPICFNFYKDRTELVLYDKTNDTIIEMSRLEKEYGFCSNEEKTKYINIVEKFITDDNTLNPIKNEIDKI